MQTEQTAPPFIRLGPARPVSPVVIAVPHAGRDYPAGLLASARVPQTVLASLEDRHADLLIDAVIAADGIAFVASRARAWIDLNRDERELDPAMVDPPPRREGLLVSAKVRGGLGLIPRRVSGGGELMRHRLSASDVEARLREDHRPWHQALSDALAAAKRHFGVAILLDCHSMPPLPRRSGASARLVLGDLHGRSAGRPFVEAAERTIRSHGLSVTRNEPYAGGYTLQRHGAPGRAIHAIQLEIDRSLYLDDDLREVGPGLARCQALVADVVQALTDEALLAPCPVAAE